MATTFSFIETLTIPFWSTNINSFTLNNYIVIQHIHGFRFNDIFLSYYIFIYMQHMFIHNRGQNFFSTRWPHSFNILSRVQNSEIPFPSHLTNLFLFSNIFIISFTFKVKFFLQNCYIFIQRFVYILSQATASSVCLTTHKGSWVKLLVCLISIVTSSSTHFCCILKIKDAAVLETFTKIYFSFTFSLVYIRIQGASLF